MTRTADSTVSDLSLKKKKRTDNKDIYQHSHTSAATLKFHCKGKIKLKCRRRPDQSELIAQKKMETEYLISFHLLCHGFFDRYFKRLSLSSFCFRNLHKTICVFITESTTTTTTTTTNSNNKKHGCTFTERKKNGFFFRGGDAITFLFKFQNY